MIWRIAIVFAVLAQSPAWGQSATVRKVFPLFADGKANGVVYTSELKILNANSVNPALQCTLTQRGTSASFIGIDGDRYYADVFDSGDSPPATTAITLDQFLPWEALRSTASSSLQTGYVALSCPGDVHAELRTSLFDLSGRKLGEATILPAASGASFEFLIDRRDGTRLGIALANDSDVEGEYTIIARDEFRQEVNRGYGTIGAWSQTSRFVDEVLPLPAGFVGTIEVVGLPGGRSYVVGLQFTGPVFATATPVVRDAALGS